MVEEHQIPSQKINMAPTILQLDSQADEQREKFDPTEEIPGLQGSNVKMHYPKLRVPPIRYDKKVRNQVKRPKPKINKKKSPSPSGDLK